MAKVKSKEVATIGSTAMVLTDRPDHIKTGKRGSEQIGLDDLTIPRLDVIQDLSPQRKRNRPEYIEGADSGMLFNSVSGKLYGDSIIFVPVFFRKEWIIWGDRKKDHEGFFGAYPSEQEAFEALSEREDADRCEVVKTDQQFGLIVDPESTGNDPQVEEVVISMSKSKAKVSRRLNSILQMADDDRFARMFEVAAIEDTNASNQSFYNLSIRQLGFCPEALYNVAEEMYNQISSGVKDVNRQYDAGNAAPTEEETGDAEY